MPGLFLSLRGSRRRILRVASLALVALQGAVAVSPLFEPRTEALLGTHAEPDGARHVNLHNASTCELCSARAQTSMPAPVSEPLALSRPCFATGRVTCAGRSGDDARGNYSRAPPALPA